jgi:hypothetical protein
MKRLAWGGGLFVLSMLGVAGLAEQGCTTTTTDAPRDSGTDASEASTGDDASTPPAEAGKPPCTSHPESGSLQAVQLANPGGTHAAMALDANDDPMFAFLAYPNDVKDARLMFVRWDPCTASFTMPVAVDPGSLGLIADDERSARQVAIAYDAAKSQIAIVYEKRIDNATTTAWLATSSDAGKTFTLQQVSEGTVAESVSVVAKDGKIFIAYAQGSAALWVLESQTPIAVDAGADASTDAGDASADASTDAATDAPADADLDAAADAATDASADADAASPPPSTGLIFDRQSVQYGGANVNVRNDAAISLAVDDSGAPAVAFFTTPSGSSNTELLFWRKLPADAGVAQAVKITDTNGNVNASLDVTLRFEQLKPRVAGHLFAGSADAGADAATDNYDLIFSASDNGTWLTAPIHVPRNGDNRTGITSALALNGKGGAALAASTISPLGDAGIGNPYLATSIDEKAWTATAGADKTSESRYIVRSLNAAYGSDGKLRLGFHNTEFQSARPGIIFWRE